MTGIERGTVCRFSILVSFLLLLLTAVASAAEPWKLDRARQQTLDQILHSSVANGDLPGAVLLLTDKDRILYSQAVGMLDPATGKPLEPGAIFNIASMTKPITSVAAMMLVDEGKLALDDPASRYLPELKGRPVLVSVDRSSGAITTRPSAREITVRDLLRHTSGIAYSFSNQELRALEQVSKLPAREAPLVHDPGLRWTYGMGTAQLGWIIENVSGIPLEEFFRRRIFGPLGMNETSFSLPEAKASRLMTQFRRRDGQLVPKPRLRSVAETCCGDGDLFSTAPDYARFMQLILGGGLWRGSRLLGASAIKEMTRNQLGRLTVLEQPSTMPSLASAFPLGSGRDGFGLGFQIARQASDGRPDGTLSWAGLYNTHFWIDRKNGFAAVLLTQVLPFYDRQVIHVLRSVERALYGLPSPAR